MSEFDSSIDLLSFVIGLGVIVIFFAVAAVVCKLASWVCRIMRKGERENQLKEGAKNAFVMAVGACGFAFLILIFSFSS